MRVCIFLVNGLREVLPVGSHDFGCAEMPRLARPMRLGCSRAAAGIYRRISAVAAAFKGVHNLGRCVFLAVLGEQENAG